MRSRLALGFLFRCTTVSFRAGAAVFLWFALLSGFFSKNPSLGAQTPTQKEKTSQESKRKEIPTNIPKENKKRKIQTETNADSESANLQEKPNPLLLRAEEHYFKKRYHIALRLLKRVIDEEPENPRAYLYAADIYLIQQNYGLAEEYFEIARELARNPYAEWFRLGQVRFLRKDAKGALQAFQTSYKLKPDMHKNLFYIGMVYYHLLRDKEKTIHYWKEFRKKAPEDSQGPAIDKALLVLADPKFQFPKKPEPPCFVLPSGKETKVPYKPGRDEKEKTDNKGEELIEIDDL